MKSMYRVLIGLVISAAVVLCDATCSSGQDGGRVDRRQPVGGTVAADNVSPDGGEYGQQKLSELLKDPDKRLNMCANVSEILGIISGICLFTGAVLGACMKQFASARNMAIGAVASIAFGLIAPGTINMAAGNGSAAAAEAAMPVGISFAVASLLVYFFVFVLPTIIAFQCNKKNKILIAAVNAVGVVVPCLGIIALYLALKNEPESQGNV